jgi:hypothetical protein
MTIEGNMSDWMKVKKFIFFAVTSHITNNNHIKLQFSISKLNLDLQGKSTLKQIKYIYPLV